MTNPDNIVRVRARNGGRASVYEANGWCQGYTSGLFEGNGVLQNTSADMNVLVGGSSSKPDVVLAENPAGYKIALDLVGQQAVAITAPATNSRISAIVAYTDDLSLQSTEDTVTGSPASCGLIVVNGTASASPSEPTGTQIRAAITSDGATGSQACYAIIATILVSSDTTIITSNLITINNAGLKAQNIDFATFDDDIFPIVNTATSNNNVNSGSSGIYYDQYSYTVPVTGIYYMMFSQRLRDGVNGYDFTVRIVKNGEEVQKVASGGATYTNYIAPTASAVFRAEAGDVLKCQSRGGGPNSYTTMDGITSIARLA